MLEKLCVRIIVVVGSLLVNRLSSMAMSRPMIVTVKAASFRIGGIVIGIIEVGGIFIVRMNPAKILPRVRRVIGFVRFGLFSLIGDIGGKRGWLSKAK